MLQINAISPALRPALQLEPAANPIMSRIDAAISGEHTRIIEQRELVARLRSEGRDARRAERLLEIMYKTLELMRHHRRTVMTTIDPRARD